MHWYHMYGLLFFEYCTYYYLCITKLLDPINFPIQTDIVTATITYAHKYNSTYTSTALWAFHSHFHYHKCIGHIIVLSSSYSIAVPFNISCFVLTLQRVVTADGWCYIYIIYIICADGYCAEGIGENGSWASFLPIYNIQKILLQTFV